MYPSLGEIGIVLLIAFMFLGPEKIPVVARKLGRFVGMARATTAELRRALEAEVDALENPLNEVKKALDPVRDMVEPLGTVENRPKSPLVDTPVADIWNGKSAVNEKQVAAEQGSEAGPEPEEDGSPS